MKRIIYMIFRSFFNMPYYMFKIFKMSNNMEKYDTVTRYRFLRDITRKVNRRGGITIECHGLDNIPKETGYILFPNHQGMFDAMAFLETHERPFATVSKIEVTRVFFLRNIIRMLQAEIIDRDDLKQSLTVIQNVARRALDGENFLVFPEGTRSKQGNKVGEFKGGAFKSAMKAKCPVVPVALVDAYKIFDTNSIKKTTVQIHYMEPLYYEDYKDMKSTQIAALLQERIQDEINRHVVPN